MKSWSDVRHQPKPFRLPQRSMNIKFPNASKWFLKVLPAPMITIIRSNVDTAFGRPPNRTAAFGCRTSGSRFDEMSIKMDAGATFWKHSDALWKLFTSCCCVRLNMLANNILAFKFWYIECLSEIIKHIVGRLFLNLRQSPDCSQHLTFRIQATSHCSHRAGA